MLDNEELEAQEKMDNLQFILDGFEADQETKYLYHFAVRDDILPNNGPCRIVLDFPSIAEAEKLVSSLTPRVGYPVGMYPLDSIIKKDVAKERTFIVRSTTNMPKPLQLKKIRVHVTQAGREQ